MVLHVLQTWDAHKKLSIAQQESVCKCKKKTKK